MVDGGPWDNATINNLLHMIAPNSADEVLLKASYLPYPTASGILMINRGVGAIKDVSCLGNLSSESPTVLHFASDNYTFCINTDIGKPVKVNDVELPHTVLFDYDNDARKWWLSRPYDNISNGSTLTLGGTPAGTGSGIVDQTVMNTGGGAVMIGRSYEQYSDPPRICLTNGDTLYITAGSSIPNGIDAVTANLKVKDLTTTGNVSVHGDLNVESEIGPLTLADDNSIKPNTDGHSSLGESTKMWGNVFTRSIVVGNYTAHPTNYMTFYDDGTGLNLVMTTSQSTGGILPASGKQLNLGSSNQKWNAVYCSSLTASSITAVTSPLTINSGVTISGNANISGYAQFNNNARLTWVDSTTLAVTDVNGVTANAGLDVGSVFVNNLQPLNSGSPAGININCPLNIGGSRGSSGQVLTSNGSSSSPTWQNMPAQQWTAGTVSSVTTPLTISSNALSLPQANGSTNGYLSSGDWNTFNNKYGSGSTPTFNGISMNGNIIPTVAGSPSAGYYCGSSSYPWKMVDTYYLYANTINALSGSIVNMACTLAFGNNPFTITSTSTITNLCADLLDGQHASYYLNASNLNAGTVPTARIPTITSGMTNFANQTVTTTSDPEFNSVKGNYSGGAVKAGNYITLSWDATYSNITAHNRHLLLNTDSGKYVKVSRDLQVGSTLSTGSYAVIGGNITPSTGNSYDCGNATYYWAKSYAWTVYGHQSGYFDAYDDLAIVKQWGEKNPTIGNDYATDKIKPPTTDPFSILKGAYDEVGGTGEFFNYGKMHSFTLGCVKTLAKKQDENEARFLALLNEVEALKKEISVLKCGEVSVDD
ncbi:MAG: hypothetical protein NWE95_06770 [Candidatus Bathyarchaeota archaeon]|nr:hypothetical protein [Candidatus Bathyarchaeota archaeon]